MPRRNPVLVTNEIYHIFNRGVEKRDIFLNDRDYEHFIETVAYYQFPNRNKLSRRSNQTLKQLSNRRLVEILAFCLMPNHFHLLLKQKEDNGVSNFMRIVGDSFTKYFNIKNDRIGPLFQGHFRSIFIKNENQLVHTSRYIHLNPLISDLVTDLKKYQWSSYPIYISSNQEEKESLVPINVETVKSHFASKEDYEKFVLDQADYARTLEEIKHIIFD